MMGYFKCGLIILISFLLQSETVNSLKLPSYITPCKRTAIDINECAKRNGQAAIPSILEGDSKYRIPNMLPFKIPHVSFDASGNLKISMKNAEIYGLENTQIQDAKIDINNQHLKFNVFISRANLIAEYDIKGRILILPISGHGPANITFVDGMFVYEIDYDIVQKKGVEYMVIKKSVINYETKRTYFQLSNLFNGDQRLSDEMNNFLNENWRDVSKDIGPALTETISQIISSILSAIMKKVPYSDILPE